MDTPIDDPYRRIVTHLTVGVYLTDADGAIVYLNEQVTRIVGMPAEQIMGMGWLTAVDSADRPRITEKARQAIRSGQPFFDEFCVVRPDGSSVPVISAGRPELDEHGA
ncbi:MAG: PAS domain-containing protein [Gammaproteobacteria bacterium]